MESKIDVSLIILNYNRAPFLDRAIRSCLNQRAGNLGIELIVVDDGSTDNSLSVIQKYEKIQLIRIPGNKGVGYASSIAFDSVTGRYFMRVDADDHISEESVGLLTGALERHDQYGFAHGDIRKIFDESGERETIALDNSETLYEHGAGVLFRSSIVREVGGYNPHLRNCEDLDLFLRLEKNGVEGLRIPQTFYRYHIHSGNTSLDSSRNNIRAELYSEYS